MKPGIERASNRLATVVVSLITALALIVVVVIVWLMAGHLKPKPFGEVPMIPADHCVADAGDYTGSMSPEQAGNAAIIVGEAIRRGLPARASTIALVTAWQESSLRNLDYGDRDSLGLFQQRPSQGWGTAEQIMDPWYAAGKFYDALVKVKHWQSDDITDVSQEVQRSAYPDAYRQHEDAGRAFASSLTGYTVAGVRCVANDGPGGGGAALIALLNKVWGKSKKLDIGQQGLVLTINTPDIQTAWSVAQLSMVQLAAYGMVSVQVGAWYLALDSLALTPWQNVQQTQTPPAIPDAQVVLTLR